jgi:hypothetical protein
MFGCYIHLLNHEPKKSFMQTKPFPKSFQLFCLIVLLISSAQAQEKLPKEWQPGMTISFSYGGGMRYYSYEAVISDTASSYIVNDEGRVTHYKLNISKKQRNEILQFMRDHRFPELESELTGPTHDKGSETISLKWDGSFIDCGEGHATAIREKDKEDYSAIRNYLFSLVEKTKEKKDKERS